MKGSLSPSFITMSNILCLPCLIFGIGSMNYIAPAEHKVPVSVLALLYQHWNAKFQNEDSIQFRIGHFCG